VRRLALIVGGYALLSIIALWALVTQLTDVVPNGPSTDYHHFTWNYWWMRHALQTGVSPWYTDFVLYPQTHNLAIHTLVPLWLPFFMLLEPFVGRVAFFNTALLLSFTLSGTAMFYWIRPWVRYPWIAFVAGALFMFQPYVLSSAASAHLNILAIWWLPLIGLLWRGVVQARSRWRWAFLLGIALWGCWLTDFQVPLFLGVSLTPYVLWTLWQAGNDAWRLVAWGALATGIMVCGMLFWPLPPLLAVDTSNPYMFPPASMESIRAWSLPISALWGDTSDSRRTLGLVTPWLILIVPLVVFWFQRGKRRIPAWLWLASAVPGLLLMLGSDVVVGDTQITLPYRLLHQVFDGQYRTPERFVIPGMFAAITFAALIWDRWARRIPRVATLALLVVLLWDVGVFDPFPVRPVRDYPFYEVMREESGDYVVLDVPVGVHYGWTGIGVGQYAQFFAPSHEKRMVNGFLARMPYPEYAFFADSPLFTWLAYGDERPDAAMQTVAATFNDYMADWPIGYVVAHMDWMTPEQRAVWVPWLNMQPNLCPPGISEDGIKLWWRSVALGCDDTSPPAQIDMGEVWQYVGAGWYDAEDIGGVAGRWATEQASLRVDLSPELQYTVTFMALAFHEERTVTINGVPVTISPDDWQTYSVTIRGDRFLTLTHDRALSPEALAISSDVRLLSVAYSYFMIEPVAD